jgi:hypothetical protein
MFEKAKKFFFPGIFKCACPPLGRIAGIFLISQFNRQWIPLLYLNCSVGWACAVWRSFWAIYFYLKFKFVRNLKLKEIIENFKDLNYSELPILDNWELVPKVDASSVFLLNMDIVNLEFSLNEFTTLLCKINTDFYSRVLNCPNLAIHCNLKKTVIKILI